MKNSLTCVSSLKNLALISRAFLLFITISITACGGGGSSSDADMLPLNSASLTIDVITRSALPIPAGSITIADKTATITAGRAEFTELAAGKVQGVVRVPGFVPANVFAFVVEGESNLAQAILLPVGASITFAADQPADLQHDGNAVRLTANSFVDDQGNPVSGTITAHLTSFDPSKDLRAAPGPFRGINADGTEDHIESYAMASYSFEADGKPVQLAAGKTAAIEIELIDIKGDNKGATLNEIIPAWYYDLEQGQWIEEGSGTVFDVGNRLVWTATVEHFTYWNADRKITENECVTVELPFSLGRNFPIFSEGRDYTGVAIADIPENSMSACVEYKRGGSATIHAGSGSSGFLYSQQIVGSGDPAECSVDGSPNVGCTIIQVRVPDLSCVRGKVLKEALPVDNARVLVEYGQATGLALTETNGEFCTVVPTSRFVSVRSSLVDETGYHFVTDTAVTGDSIVSCATPELCTDIGVQELNTPPQYCMDGQVTQNIFTSNGVSNVPVSAGTPLLAFRKDSFSGLDCQTTPNSWGSIVAEGTIGENGDYCLTLPLAENTRELVFVANSCNRNSCNTDEPEDICFRTGDFTLINGAETGFTGGFCGSTISCIDNDIHIGN